MHGNPNIEIGKEFYMFTIKSGSVMGPKQFHIHHETVIRSGTICQTQIATLLYSGLQKQLLSKCCVQNKMVCPYFGIVNALCLLINVCFYCRCETNFGTLHSVDIYYMFRQRATASFVMSVYPSVCMSVCPSAWNNSSTPDGTASVV